MTYIEISMHIDELKKNRVFLEDMQTGYTKETEEYRKFQSCINVMQAEIDYLQYEAQYDFAKPGEVSTE